MSFNSFDGDMSIRQVLTSSSLLVLKIHGVGLLSNKPATEITNDLFVTIKEFFNTETAKFITGDRAIEELPDCFDELDALGVQDYIKIYSDYYASVLD